jgi:hypothetical protein
MVSLPMVFYFQLSNEGCWLIQVIELGFWMPLAPICILYLGFQGKNLYVMFVFSIVHFLLFY